MKAGPVLYVLDNSRDVQYAKASLAQIREAGYWPDAPEFDATDGACPAWWRGHDYGVNGSRERIAGLVLEISEYESQLNAIDQMLVALFFDPESDGTSEAVGKALEELRNSRLAREARNGGG